MRNILSTHATVDARAEHILIPQVTLQLMPGTCGNISKQRRVARKEIES